MRKARAFRGGATKTAPPCETVVANKYLATVPGEQLQRNITLQKILLLEKTVFSIRQKGVPPLLLPASVLQLPRCLVRIYNLDSHRSILFELDSFKRCNCSRKTNCKIKFAPQMWATRPHLANIFEKLLDQKTFICLRLAFCNQFHTKQNQQTLVSDKNLLVFLYQNAVKIFLRGIADGDICQYIVGKLKLIGAVTVILFRFLFISIGFRMIIAVI